MALAANMLEKKDGGDEQEKIKLPSQNLEAESSLLGCILLDKDTIKNIPDLKAEDFYDDRNAEIFENMQQMHSENIPIDIISLTDRLESKGKLMNLGGRTYLAELTNSAGLVNNIENYAKIIKDKSALRKLREIGYQIGELSSEDKSISELISIIQKSLDGLKVRNNSPFEIENLNDIKNADYGKDIFLVDKLIRSEGITLLSAQPKSGKSFVALEAAIKISQGKNLFGHFKTKKSKVLIIDEENSKRGLQRRIKKLTGNEDVDIPILSMSGFLMIKNHHREFLKKYIEENKIELVIFDSFRRLTSFDENSSTDINEFYGLCKEIMESGVAILLIHHNKKLDKFQKITIDVIRGSGDIGAIAENIVILKTKPLANLSGNLTTFYTFSREDLAQKPFDVEWLDLENGGLEFIFKGEKNSEDKIKGQAKEHILNFLGNNDGEFTEEDIKQKGDFGKDIFKKALKELIDEKIIMVNDHRENEKWNKKFYSLSG